jgi:hypothetical protein
MATNNAINLSAQGVAYYNGSGTFSAPTITQYAPVIGAAANDLTTTTVLTNGQILIGSTGVAPVPATLTAGTGITIVNGAGTITLNSTGAGFTWNDVTGGSASMAVNNGYLADSSSLTTLTLPATAAQFSSVWISGYGAGGWTIAQNSGQLIHLSGSTTTTGTGGSLSSTNRYDQVLLLCVVANTTWVALNSIGNLTVV